MLRYQGWDVEARPPTVNDADNFDLLVLQRHADPVAELIMAEFQDKGKPVIYDCDDWLFGLPPSWDCYGQYFVRGQMAPTAALLHHERLLRKADAVTCTTKDLADKLRPYNQQVYVAPNCVLWGDWDIVSPFEKELEGPVVGWFGLPYHWDSWRLLAPAIEEVILEAGANLAILGFPEVVNCFSPALAEKTIVQPATTWRDFHTMRRMIASFDVGLCWLEDTPFNRCKSELRALQYGAAGVPMVASPTAYGDVLWDGEDETYLACMAKSPVNVRHALYNLLLVDTANMAEAKKRARLWQNRVWERHSYETQWHVWAAVLEEALHLR